MQYFMREHENNFSFWFPKVKDCGLNVPKTFYKNLPDAEKEPDFATRLYQAFYMEHPEEDKDVIESYVETEIIPELQKMKLTGHLFVKNARFSNKFNANGSCSIYGLHDLARAITNINYEAMCCGADGIDEIVVREFIEYDHRVTPCIYNGLPLRPEFRVFYDFDKKVPIFTANYWDYGYVYPHLYEATDRIIFEHEKERIENTFNDLKYDVQEAVAESMFGVEGLTGQWSVDIMIDANLDMWLIDMAIAQRSAYWENRPDKVTYPE